MRHYVETEEPPIGLFAILAVGVCSKEHAFVYRTTLTSADADVNTPEGYTL